MTAPDPTKPWAGYIQDQQYTAFQDRMIQIGKVCHQATVSGLNTRNGVFLGGGTGQSNINLNVRANGGMNLLIDAGSAIIDGYSVINPIQQSMTVDPATATARRDAVILRVYDTEAGDATSKTVLEITKGTTTSDPPLPARSLLLAVVDVPANATSVTPVDRRDFTTSVGGIVPYYGSRPDITTIANGQIVHSLNTGLNDQRDGDLYHPLGANMVGNAGGAYNFLQQVDVGGILIKEFDFVLNRQANALLLFGSITLQSLGSHSTIHDMQLLWDGALVTAVNANTAGLQYNSYSFMGFVSNQVPGAHKMGLSVKPVAGDGLQVAQWIVQGLALS